MYDSYVEDPKFFGGIECDKHAPIQWEISERSLFIRPCFSMCVMLGEKKTCNAGWIYDKHITVQLFLKLQGPELRKCCEMLDTKRDHAYSYRVDYIVKYICVKEANPLHHLKGRGVIFSCEVGHSGITHGSVQTIIRLGCERMQDELNMRIHYIDCIEIRLSTPQTLRVGGCPQLVDHYQRKCHPAVCICDGNRPVSFLCHQWYMDSILGGDRDMKLAHPAAVFPNGKVTHFRHVAHTIFRMTDEIVWGGILAKSGVVLRFVVDHVQVELGVTSFQGNAQNMIHVSINTKGNQDPKLFCETLLHELAHARVAIDVVGCMGIPHHGSDWLTRMNDIKKLLAFRLSNDTISILTKRMKKRHDNAS